MILLWFLAGILFALCIARYNESNRLFWQLSIAFLLGYAVTVMVNRTNGSEKSNANLTQVCPTQGQIEVQSVPTLFQLYNGYTNKSVTGSIPVSQEFTPDKCEDSVISSEISRRTRDQPTKLLKPPQT